MPRTSPYEIELSSAERNELESLVRKYTAPYQEVVRAKIILMANEDYTNSEIATRLELPRRIASNSKSAQLVWRIEQGEGTRQRFEWKFTRDDLHRLLAKLEKEPPGN